MNSNVTTGRFWEKRLEEVMHFKTSLRPTPAQIYFWIRGTWSLEGMLHLPAFDFVQLR